MLGREPDLICCGKQNQSQQRIQHDHHYKQEGEGVVARTGSKLASETVEKENGVLCRRHVDHLIRDKWQPKEPEWM